MLRQTVADNAVHRTGHQPFHRTIGTLLNDMAKDNIESAFVRDELEQIKLGKPPRNV